jgi:hypothetical protein
MKDNCAFTFTPPGEERKSARLYGYATSPHVRKTGCFPGNAGIVFPIPLSTQALKRCKTISRFENRTELAPSVVGERCVSSPQLVQPAALVLEGSALIGEPEQYIQHGRHGNARLLKRIPLAARALQISLTSRGTRRRIRRGDSDPRRC